MSEEHFEYPALKAGQSRTVLHCDDGVAAIRSTTVFTCQVGHLKTSERTHSMIKYCEKCASRGSPAHSQARSSFANLRLSGLENCFADGLLMLQSY